MPIQFIRRFIQMESSSGILLIIMTLIALFWANSPFVPYYEQIKKTLLFWVNDGLMVLFFFLIGLELKREFFGGSWATSGRILLPLVAALGGMVVPALIYFAINRDHPQLLKGWAIPVATDIAFALGVLSLLGRRISLQLKLFLMALAIFDDLGAIIVIAIFYAHDVSFYYLALSLVLLVLILLLRRFSIKNTFIYFVASILLWFLVLRSGIHPTIAGILLAFVLPYSTHLEKTVQPWVIFGIVPLFALLNGGVAWPNGSINLKEGILFGTFLGLFVGKQLGVFGSSWLVIKLGAAKLPQHTSWAALYGTSVLCGIGFTMSLFIGTLTFENGYLDQARLGILLGSLLSGLLGAIILYSVVRSRNE